MWWWITLLLIYILVNIAITLVGVILDYPLDWNDWKTYAGLTAGIVAGLPMCLVGLLVVLIIGRKELRNENRKH